MLYSRLYGKDAHVCCLSMTLPMSREKDKWTSQSRAGRWTLLHMREGTGSREGSSLGRRAQHPLLTGTLTDQTGSSWWCWWQTLQRGCWQLPAQPHKSSSACKPAPPLLQSWVPPQQCRCWGWGGSDLDKGLSLLLEVLISLGPSFTDKKIIHALAPGHLVSCRGLCLQIMFVFCLFSDLYLLFVSCVLCSWSWKRRRELDIYTKLCVFESMCLLTL